MASTSHTNLLMEAPSDEGQTSTGMSNATALPQDLTEVQPEMEAGRQAAADMPVSNEIAIDVLSEAGNSNSNARSHVSDETTILNASTRLVGAAQPEPRSETDLHKAVRRRDNAQVFIDLSSRHDAAELARKPDSSNMPPLYLAVYLGYSDITQILIDKFGNRLSSDGPNGQNVLHIAALRSKDLTEKILTWRPQLHNDADNSEVNKPLHYAATFGIDGVTSLLLEKDNNGVVSQVGSEGMCPIHIAASFGAMDAIRALVGGNDVDDSSASLLDTNDRTFLHVAVENRRTNVVKYLCRKSRFGSILNLKDQDGNTALHLAVKTRDVSIFSHLLGNRLVELNHVNNEGYTPLDIASMIQIQQSYASRQNPTEWMIRVLAHSGACFSGRMRGSSAFGGTQNHHQEDMARSTESVLVASALIATVTFAAAFTMPGSYKTEGHPKAGTPAFGGHYGFKVFLVADIIAFFCSVAATYSLAEYGSRGDPLVRCIYTRRAVALFHVALKSVIIAFTLGVSVVMWDISVSTTIIVAVAASVLVLYGNEALAHDCRLLLVMYRRFGLSLSWTLYPSTSSHLDWNSWRLRSFSMTLAWNTFKLFSAYIFIFAVAYLAQLY